MRFARPLIRGILIRRYKRFLADVRLDDGREVTAHCANPGAMLGLSAPGLPVWLEPVDAPQRKLAFAWRLVDLPGGHWAGIDTGVPNRLVGEALRARALPRFAACDDIRPEVRYAAASRVDFLARGAGRPDTYIEVKNVHLRRSGDWAEFPDCVTTRGARHLADLAAMVAQGHRAVMLYVVQRSDCARLRFAADLDPAYAAAFRAATAAGVEACAYRVARIDGGLVLGDELPVLAPSDDLQLDAAGPK